MYDKKTADITIKDIIERKIKFMNIIRENCLAKRKNGF